MVPVLPTWWFDFIVVLSAIILVKNHNGTLEESLDNFEKKIGLYTYVDTSHREETDAPYYIPPIEEKVDSTFILPPHLQKNDKEKKDAKSKENNNT